MSLVCCVLSLRKRELQLFSVKLSVKLYRFVPYRYFVVLDLVSFWDAFRKCFRKMTKDNRKPFKIYSSTQTIMSASFSISWYILQSYPSKWGVSATEMHCQNYLSDAFINAEKITLHFTNPLVNAALKFYVLSLTSCNINF